MYSAIKIRIIVVVLLFSQLQAFSQIVTNVRHYSTAEGLSDNRITDVIKDKEGFMWFGSWAGITRFDGLRFVTYKSYPGDRSSLESNRIDEIVEGYQSRHFWLKAYDKRIYRFDKRTGDIESLSKILNQPALNKISFTRIWSAKGSNLWLQSERMGVYLISNSHGAQPRITVFASNKDSNHKLPSNSIDFFQVDKDGNAWVGTKGGIVHIRKVSDERYRVINLSLKVHQEITSLVEVGDGNTWLLGNSGSLIGVDKNLAKIGEIKFASSITKISESRRSNVFYCTTLSGELYSISAQGRPTLLLKTKDSSTLSYVFEDSRGNLWIESASSVVIRYDPKTRTTQHLFVRNAYPYDPGVINYPMFEDKDARVWININKQLHVFQSESRGVIPLEKLLDNRHQMLPGIITRVFYDTTGVLWIGSGYDGISKIVFQEQAFTRKILVPAGKSNEDNDVRGVLFDSKNRLWAGTKAGKLFVDERGQISEGPLNGKSINKAGIYSICEDSKNNIWFGTKANGLIQAVPSKNTHADYLVYQYTVSQMKESISSNSIYCLFQDREGRLWAGSYEEGLILINSGRGKTAFKTLKNSFRNYPKEGFRKIRHIAQDSKGLIWVGTTDGLLIFNPNSGTPERYLFRAYRKKAGDIHSLGGNDVQYIIRDSDNNMWVLTTTGGLNLASRSNPLQKLSFINFSVKNGLPSDYLLSGIEDEQKNLWIASQNGLLKFSLKDRKWQTFNRNDGLGAANFSEASCSRAQDGKIVFGTSSGLITFYPKQIKSSQTNANLVFSNLQVNSQDIIPGQGSPLKFTINETRRLVLKHDQNSISIDFAILDFHSTENQNFAHRLLGFDSVWNNSAGQKRATYTKLPPGDYTFEVKSLNDDLYRKAPFKSINIIISPPFWLTWWAYLLYALLFVFAAFLIRRVVVTVLKLKQSVEVEKRLAELKLNFFTQISHELRTPLTLIINPIEEIQKSTNLSKKENDYINVVVNNSHRMLRLVNQVLDLRKVQSGNVNMKWEGVEIVGFINSIIEYFRDTLMNRNIRIEVRKNTPKMVVNIDRDKIEIVVYNLLANAIKFSDNNSSIFVQILQSDDLQNLTLEVADQGPGVEATELEKIFQLYYEGNHKKDHQVKGSGIGLALSKELIELHNGKIYASNQDIGGLKVGFILPQNSSDAMELKTKNDCEITQKLWLDEQPQNFSTSEELSQNTSAMSRLVLIVEDNDELRLFLSSKLSGTYKVETAINGLEGLNKARSLSPDLILSDVMMPEMDGIQLLDAVKSDNAISHIPVILLTAKYSVETQLEGLRYGADYYITKPFKMELLEGAVNTIISRRQKVLRTLMMEEKVSISSPEMTDSEAETDVNVTELEMVMTELDKKFLEKVIAIVEEKLSDSQFNIEDVVDQLNMSRSTFYRKLKSLTNLTPVELVREVRLKKVKNLFDAGEDNISTAAYSVGFTNPKYLTFCFKKRYKQNPSDYIRAIRKR
ncbi:two-component regulator propeller domain-containing protein [Pedobacter sp. P351]|uniref:hybrid sensor histidine kinase/response regulator transcription factor n=1 Tax=Pedobacter superstes TaxID=3133441 RepID=UPI0030B01E88